jgi:hypothetical protein
MKVLTRFWFTFKTAIEFSPLNIGCGVTAYDYEDARNILNLYVFINKPIPEIASALANVDIRSLDQNHVIPNMGVVSDRGVWFPLGYK